MVEKKFFFCYFFPRNAIHTIPHTPYTCKKIVTKNLPTSTKLKESNAIWPYRLHIKNHPRWNNNSRGFFKKYCSNKKDVRLLEFLKNCIFRPAVVTGTLSWLFLVFTNFGAFIQYLAECKVTNTDTSHHRRQSPNLL